MSSGTARKKLTTRRWLYEAAGVPEYGLVYPEAPCGAASAGANGIYQTVFRVEWGSVLAILGGTILVLLGEQTDSA